MWHIFLLGQWTVPTISGQTLPATSHFVIEKINSSKAVMFGGWVTDGGITRCTDTLYTVQLIQTTLVSTLDMYCKLGNICCQLIFICITIYENFFAHVQYGGLLGLTKIKLYENLLYEN